MGHVNVYINVIINFLKTLIISGVVLRVIGILSKCQSKELTFQEGIVKAKKVVKAGVIAILLPSIIPLINRLYMSQLDEAHPTVHIVRLIDDVIGSILILEPLIVAYKVIGELMAIKTSDDGKEEHISNAKNTVFVGIVIICVTAVIKTIFSYYE